MPKPHDEAKIHLKNAADHLARAGAFLGLQDGMSEVLCSNLATIVLNLHATIQPPKPSIAQFREDLKNAQFTLRWVPELAQYKVSEPNIETQEVVPVDVVMGFLELLEK
jgi:hypothetical protein